MPRCEAWSRMGHSPIPYGRDRQLPEKSGNLRSPCQEELSVAYMFEL